MSFLRSVRFALIGLRYIVTKERNARIHVAMAIIALGAGVVLQLSADELAAVVFAIIAVFLAEIFNTAVEKMLDLIEPNHHEQVRLIKDMTAGAVLVAAAGAVLVAFVVFMPHLWDVLWPAQ